MEFFADAGAGGVVPGPLGVGGELDGHAALGDAFDHRRQRVAVPGGSALGTTLVFVRVQVVLAAVGQGRLEVGRHAGQGVGDQFVNDGLRDLFQDGPVGVNPIGADVVVGEGGRLGEEVFLAGAGLDGVDGLDQRLLGRFLAQGGSALGTGLLNGLAAFLAGQAAIGLHGQDEGAFNPARGELGGIGGFERGEDDLLGLGQGVQLRLVEQAALLFGHGGAGRGRGIGGCGVVRHNQIGDGGIGSSG